LFASLMVLCFGKQGDGSSASKIVYSTKVNTEAMEPSHCFFKTAPTLHISHGLGLFCTVRGGTVLRIGYNGEKTSYFWHDPKITKSLGLFFQNPCKIENLLKVRKLASLKHANFLNVSPQLCILRNGLFQKGPRDDGESKGQKTCPLCPTIISFFQ
jgi:hypothetical protein